MKNTKARRYSIIDWQSLYDQRSTALLSEGKRGLLRPNLIPGTLSIATKKACMYQEEDHMCSRAMPYSSGSKKIERSRRGRAHVCATTITHLEGTPQKKLHHMCAEVLSIRVYQLVFRLIPYHNIEIPVGLLMHVALFLSRPHLLLFTFNAEIWYCCELHISSTVNKKGTRFLLHSGITVSQVVGDLHTAPFDPYTSPTANRNKMWRKKRRGWLSYCCVCFDFII